MVEHLLLRPEPPKPLPTPDAAEKLFLPVCVDDTTRYAPTALPDGWERFVLDIAPNGARSTADFPLKPAASPGPS